MSSLQLVALVETFAMCRLAPSRTVPQWALEAGFVSITRTAEELSIVCPERIVPPDVPAEGGWRCLRVAGKLDFSMVGILASLCGPLAGAGISLFAVSTFDTDYLLIKADDFARAIEVLQSAGHLVTDHEG